MRRLLRWLLLTQPSTAIVWLLNTRVIQWILNQSLFKSYLTVRAVSTLCLIGVCLLILYDFRLVGDGIDKNTWSELMRVYGQRHLILPWLCGVLIGHLFHQHDGLLPLGGRLQQIEAYNLIFWLSAGWLSAGLLLYWWAIDVPVHLMTIVAIIGYSAGHYLWPIKRDPTKWTW